MPSVEVFSDAAIPSSHRPLFRSHKTLPRKRDVGPLVDALHIYSGQDAVPANGNSIATAPSLPLTPPVVNDDDGKTTELELQANESIKSDRTIQALTPTRSQRLLTPDITPPRNTSNNQPDTNQLPQLLSSSRAESFRTACENIPSDAETENSFLSTRSLQQSRQNAQTQKLLQESGQQTLSAYSGAVSTPREQPIDADRSISGSCHSQSVNSRREYRTDALAITPTRKKPLSSSDQNNVCATDVSAPSVKETRDPLDVPERGRSLRDRVNDSQKDISSPSVEQFGEVIGWPSMENPSNPIETPDSRRLSGVSTASTVEAIIIDSPRPAKRALRHTEKRLSLRSASSPITRSERTSIASNPDSQHRLIHKAARITEQDRRSIASEMSVSAASTLGAVQSNVEVVPVVVIPERRSSLQSSNANSRDQSRSCSRRSSQRTTLASRSRAGSHDRPRRRNRTVSDSAPRLSQESNPRGRSFSRPVIPPRSSSLSAPTSRNNSRATSLTSESLRHHTLAMEPEGQKPETKLEVQGSHGSASDHSHDNQGAPNGHLAVSADGMGELRPPSLPVTQGSIHSLSPGPVEISEATAVSFFPHNNESLLLVNQKVMPESPAVQAVKKNYRGMLDGPRTPHGSSQTLPADVESPLRNPRPPSKPPACKVIPPTPTDEVDRQFGGQGDSESSNGGLGRRFGSVRRALSARQRSNSSSTPVKRSFSTSAKSRKPVTDIDSRLQSFWRPRRFWDDSAETSPEKKEPLDERSPETNQIISNSLGMPQQQIIFEGPRLARRNLETRRFVDGTIRPYPSRDKLMESRVLSPDILRKGSPLHQRRFRSIRWLKLRFRPIRLRNIRKRMGRSMQRREEQKWHARRQNLKQSIGDVVHVDSSNLNLNVH
ncbi:hypothetical protein PHISCL_08921 [Aspergillus sclerotialis]|uniref:Uncharacterized protein n=1 Tax=Aspergillus sclerotialis TaxID=2070753 RepID=A0A3A2ZBR7_9EURO|nr:hypothetical protein PHISCL_08921 [Aspergillus sclerotialis]